MPNRRKAQKRNSQSRICSRASLPSSVRTGGLAPFASFLSFISVALQQVVKVNKEAKHHRGEERQQHKPASGWPRGLSFKRVGRFQHTVTHGPARTNVRSIADVLAQRVVNRLDGEWICHVLSLAALRRSSHQKCGDLHLLSVAQSIFRLLGAGKLKAQDCGLRTGRHLEATTPTASSPGAIRAVWS